MSVAVEEKLAKIPVVNVLVTILKRIKLRTFEGLSMNDLMEMYVIGIIKGTLTYRASAISFSFFMAIFPFLLFILNLIPYVPIENFQADFLLFIDNLLPPQTNDFFGSIFEDIAKNRRGGLLSTVFVLSIFLMTNGINAIFGGFEISYHVKTTRNIIKQYFIALGVAVIMALLLLLAAVIFISFDVYIVSLLEQQGISRDAWFITYGKILLFLFITYIAIAILYYFGTAEGKENSFFSPGALLTTILFVLTTYLFGIYIEHFSQYNQLYGSIGGLLIFMLYIWLNSNILLLGFELNASLNSLKRVL